jgi:hypothetical protein
MSMLLTLLFTCLTFFVVLSNHCQGLCRTFSEICTKFDAHSLLDQSQNRIRPDTRLHIEGRKKSACPPSCVKFCTLTPKIFQYYHLPLHCATTAAVQMAAPVSEIIDFPIMKLVVTVFVYLCV